MERTFVLHRTARLTATAVEDGGRVSEIESSEPAVTANDVARAETALAAQFPDDTVSVLTPDAWQAKWQAQLQQEAGTGATAG